MMNIDLAFRTAAIIEGEGNAKPMPTQYIPNYLLFIRIKSYKMGQVCFSETMYDTLLYLDTVYQAIMGAAPSII